MLNLQEAWEKLKGGANHVFIKPNKRLFQELNLGFIRTELNQFEVEILDNFSFPDEAAYQEAVKQRNELADLDAQISKDLGVPNYYEFLKEQSVLQHQNNDM